MKILACAACLDQFNLPVRKQVGQTTKKPDLVTAMQMPDKVINI